MKNEYAISRNLLPPTFSRAFFEHDEQAGRVTGVRTGDIHVHGIIQQYSAMEVVIAYTPTLQLLLLYSIRFYSVFTAGGH